MSIKPIETAYKGYRFRSRLEARWAVFFDALGIKWEYEPEGFEMASGRYLPDFLLDIGEGLYLEIKGPEPSAMEMAKCHELSQGTNKFVGICWGTMDVPFIYKNGEGYDVEGAKILMFTPPQAVLNGKDIVFPIIGLKNGFSLPIKHAAFQAFYEAPNKQIEIDKIYDQDLPFTGKPCSRSVYSVLCSNELIPVMNVGCGRAYRSERMIKAYMKARGARFEHGEVPA